MGVLIRAYIAGLTLASLALSGCGSSHSGAGTAVATDRATQVTDPTNLPGFAFVAHQLPNFFGVTSIAYSTPPYPLGASNDGKGNLNVIDLVKAGLHPILVAPRTPYDIRIADFNGDGIADVVSSVYSPTNVDSVSYLFWQRRRNIHTGPEFRCAIPDAGWRGLPRAYGNHSGCRF